MRGRHEARFVRAGLASAVALAAAACGVEGGIVGSSGSSGSSGGPDASSADTPIGDASASGNGDAETTTTTFGDSSVTMPKTVDLLAGGAAVRVVMTLDKPPSDPSEIQLATLEPSLPGIVVTPVPTASSPTSRAFDLSANAGATPQRVPIPVAVRVAGSEKPLLLTAKVSRHFRAPGFTEISGIATSTTFEIQMWGAGGGSTGGTGIGGAGGYARATAVVSGTITVQVGGGGAIATKGINAGGNAGANAAGGGGYSGVFAGGPGSVGPATLVVMAGGGGGGGTSSRGGNGGNPADPGSLPSPGLAGTFFSGGGAGSANATPGTAFLGGAGDTDGSGGGGGGGYYGGGGGGPTSGGGGGCSYAGSTFAATYENGVLGFPGARDHALRMNAGNAGTAGAVLIITN